MSTDEAGHDGGGFAVLGARIIPSAGIDGVRVFDGKINAMRHFFTFNLGDPETAEPKNGDFDAEILGQSLAINSVNIFTGIAAGPVSITIWVTTGKPKLLEETLTDWDVAAEVSALSNGPWCMTPAFNPIAVGDFGIRGPVRVRCTGRGRHAHWDLSSADDPDIKEQYEVTVWADDTHSVGTLAAVGPWALTRRS